MLGVLVPCSQYLTARGVTPVEAASAACVMPRPVRRLRSFLFNMILSLRCVDVKCYGAAVKHDLIFCRTIVALHLLDLLDGIKVNRKTGQGKKVKCVVDNCYAVCAIVAGERVRAKAE